MTKHATASVIAIPMATPNAVMLASAIFLGLYMKYLDFLCFLWIYLELSRNRLYNYRTHVEMGST